MTLRGRSDRHDIYATDTKTRDVTTKVYLKGQSCENREEGILRWSFEMTTSVWGLKSDNKPPSSIIYKKSHVISVYLQIFITSLTLKIHSNPSTNQISQNEQYGSTQTTQTCSTLLNEHTPQQGLLQKKKEGEGLD